MEEKGTNIIDDVTARVILFLCVLDSIDSGGVFYIGRYDIESAYEVGDLLDLKKYTIGYGNFFGFYSCAIKLTEDSVSYLKKELLEDKYIVESFIAYAIFNGDKCVMQVFDEICIDIDKSIHIPEWLLKECERNEVWVSFSDHIDVSRY